MNGQTWTWYTGISGTAGLVLLGIALVMWTIGRRMYPAVVLGLTISGVAGIMSTPVGGWIRNGYAWLTGLVGNTIGQYTGIAILTVATIVITVIVIVNVLGHFNTPGDAGQADGIDGRTLILGAILAFTAGTLPGAVGQVLSTVLGGVAHAFAWPITAGFGL